MRHDSQKVVLVIAYYFPPLAMGGVQRITKFCKYLPEYGWRPVVLTSSPRSYFALDTSFAEELKKTTAFEAKSLVPFSLGVGESFENWRTRLKRIARWVLIPDVRVLWVPYAVTVGFKLLRMFQVDCILATAPPWSSLLAARLLSHRSGLPLIVDFRDAWVDDPFASYPTFLHKRLNMSLERWVVSGAARVISISEEITAGMRSRCNGNWKKYRVVNQGFDPSDFEQVVERGERFTVCYTGSLIRTRKPDDLFVAVSQLIRDGVLDPKQVEVDIVGFCPSTFVEAARALGLEDVVRFRGYLPHAASVRRLLGADILWLYIAESEGKTILTGKLFEYLGSGKRIVASVPEDGAAASVIRTLGAGVVVRPGDIEGLKQVLAESHEKWQRGIEAKMPSERLKNYDRRLLAGELAEILNEACRRR